MEQKDIRHLIMMLLCISFASCRNLKSESNNFAGKWCDVNKRSTFIIIDSIENIITIDYSKNGGKVFQGTYKINNLNEIQSEILPKGAKAEIDKNGYLSFKPVKKTYTKDIESIYVFKFIKVQ